MKHKDIQKKILRYIDSELSEEERLEVEAHLKQCAQCRRDVESLSVSWQLSESVYRVQPSAFLWNRISEHLNEVSHGKYLNYRITSFIRQLAQPALTAALIIIALFTGIQVGGQLTNKNVSKQHNFITTNQVQNEFGLDNFRLLSSGSLGGEMVALMDFNNE